MDSQRPQLELLAHAGRLLLENDESTGEIHRALTTTARSLTNEPCDVSVFYGGLAVSLGQEGPLLLPVRELRFNMAVQAAVHSMLDQIRHGTLDAEAAFTQLERVAVTAPRHSRWVVILLLGVAAASLALLLGADAGATIHLRAGNWIGTRGPPGTRPATFQRAHVAVCRRVNRCRAWWHRGSAGMDAHAGARPDRTVANPCAGATFYQRTPGPVRQLSADLYFPANPRDQHCVGGRIGDHPWC